MSELKAELNTASPEEVAEALITAWEDAVGFNPSVELVATLLAHSALETGHWKAMRNYNFGNIKATNLWIQGGGHFTYYEASENLNAEWTQRALASSKPRTDGKKLGMDCEVRGRTRDDHYIVWFYPNHIQSRFRAFETLADGAKNYVLKLAGRYRKALDYACKGNHLAYVDTIHSLGYFTANLSMYRAAIGRLYNQYLPVAEQACSWMIEPQPRDAEQSTAYRRLIAAARDVLESSCLVNAAHGAGCDSSREALDTLAKCIDDADEDFDTYRLERRR